MESRSCSKEQLESSCCWTASLFPSDYWIIQSLGKQGARCAMLIAHKISQRQIYQHVIHQPPSIRFSLNLKHLNITPPGKQTPRDTCSVICVLIFSAMQSETQAHRWLEHNLRTNGSGGVSLSMQVQTQSR